MKNIKFSSEGKITFYLSFILGTLLFVSFLITGNDYLIGLGFYYVLIASVINFIILFMELLTFLSDVSKNKAHGNSVLLLLVNIPVTILYLFIVFSI